MFKYVIATEDIKYQGVFFPKGSILEEDMAFNAWTIYSSLQLAINRSKLKSRKAIINDAVPNNYRIWFYANECKWSETPWFYKVRPTTFNDKELINNYRKETSKYHDIYLENRKKYLHHQSQEPEEPVDIKEFRKWIKQLKAHISNTQFPESIRVKLKKCKGEEEYWLRIYRFDDYYFPYHISPKSKEEILKMNEEIRSFLERI